MDQWFTEDLEIAGGLRHQILVKKLLHSERTPFQKIEFYETRDYGRMLVLDDVINCTEFDEFCYHEMIVHPALFAHPNPKRVLVVGGGDGGCVREALKHPGVAEVHLCEIDERVVVLSQELLPSVSSALSNERVKILHLDGVAWVKEHPDFYDVIIVDSTDPIGPAQALFEFEFYQACRDALREEGILINQAENFLMHGDIIRELLSFGRKLFPICRYYYTQVPTYPGGLIGFTFFSKVRGPFDFLNAQTDGPGTGLAPGSGGLSEKLNQKEYQETLAGMKYWTPEVMRASFVLPASVQRSLFADQ